MNIVEVKTKRQQKRFLVFRKKCYRTNGCYVDNQYFMIRQMFAEKSCFADGKEVLAVWVEDKGRILCQGILVYAKELSEYVQLGFFESEPEQEAAVDLLIEKGTEFGRERGCKRLVIGLYGHVNYGLGFLADRYGEKNSFSAAGNPAYYNEYFEKAGCESVYLNSYKTATFGENIKRYEKIVNRVESIYTFRNFNKKNFEEDARLYTRLNNLCFSSHRYYYRRKDEEDLEMLKELFLFMKEDSLIFVYEGDKPIGFVMWYPDYNQLAKAGEIFGVRHFFRNLLFRKRIQAVKVMEFGVLEEYRRKAIPLGLVHRVYCAAMKRGISKAETSWILEENGDSNSVCRSVCEEVYKRYVVYEKEISG